MKIAIDARELCGKPTGVGRYLLELLDHWAATPEWLRHTWTIYAHRPASVPKAFGERVRVVPGSGGTRWEQWDFARALSADKPDVLFAPGYTAPLTAPCPVALTIHDVSFFARRGEFRWREGLRRRTITTWAARRARVVITVSEFSRQQIASHIGIPLDRIRAIHHGMRMPIPDTVPRREPLILYVGSIFPRRHVDTLVSAFAHEVAPRLPDARLEIVGDERLPPGSTGPREWLRDLPSPIRDRIAFRSWVDDQTLRALYARASAFAFLSDYEGFGLTPLEALATGVPAVVLDTAVAREVYGPAAHFVAAPESLEKHGRGDPAASTDLRAVEPLIGQALVELLTDESARARLLQQTPVVLARYRWDRAAQLTLDAITEAAGA